MSEPGPMEPIPMCSRCEDDGYVCELCYEPEGRCECEDELDDYDEAPELRRCRCNPYRANVAGALVPGESES